MTAALSGAVILGLMAALNRWVGRSFLYPPTLFAMLWAALLTGSALSGDRFFPLSVDSVSVFVVGAAALSAGGMLRLMFDQRRSPERAGATGRTIRSRALPRALTASLVGLILLFPLFWGYVLSVADHHFSNLWWGIRAGTIALAEVQGQKTWEQIFFDNITVAAILLALTAVAHFGERRYSRLVAIGLVLMAAVYNFSTGSRAGVANVLLGALGVQLFKRGRMSARQLFGGAAAVVLMYVPLTLLRSAKGGEPASIGTDGLRVVLDTALLYTVGPLVAFDAYLRNPVALSQTWSVSYFFLHAANRLGFDVAAPSTHMGYVTVGQQGATNVYTMYFAYYPEFGLAGVAVLSAIVGFLLVWVFQAASSRRDYMLILYGLAFNEISKSGFNEGFFLSLNMWLKAGGYCLVLFLLHRTASARVARRSVPELKPICCE